MLVRDEFEYVATDGIAFDVSVVGDKGYKGFLLHEITILDSIGNTIDVDDDHYEEILKVASLKDYEVEIFDNDFDYGSKEINNFLKEDN